MRALGSAYGLEHELNISNSNSTFRTDSYLCCPSMDTLLVGHSYKGVQDKYGLGIRSGRFWLFNGGCFYYDMHHLEYCSPECSTLKDIVNYSHAGYRIAYELIKNADENDPNGHKHYLFANGNDHVSAPGKFVSIFGIHENYSLKNDDEMASFGDKNKFLPFLNTRGMLTGAGYVPYRRSDGRYYLSERSDQTSLMINPTNDGGRRLEIKGSDANICSESIALKYGITDLVIRLIAEGESPFSQKGYFNPTALSEMRRNLSANPRRLGDCRISADTGNLFTAFDIQEAYLNAADKRFGRLGDPEVAWVLKAWEHTLQTLQSDFTKATWLDWVIKYNYLEKMRNKGMSQADLRDFDRAYHLIDPKASVYPLVSKYPLFPPAIERAMVEPPKTRATWRSRLLYQYGTKIIDMNWSEVSLASGRLNNKEPLFMKTISVD